MTVTGNEQPAYSAVPPNPPSNPLGCNLDCSSSIQNSTLTTTGETLVLASIFPLPVGAVEPSVIHAGLLVVVYGIVNAGTATTGITVRIRRGFGTGGTIDGELTNIAVTPGVNSPFVYATSVNSGWLYTPPGGQYSVTFQQVGATGNGTVEMAVATYSYSD